MDLICRHEDWYKAIYQIEIKELRSSQNSVHGKKFCLGYLKDQFWDLFYLISFYVIYFS